MAEVEAAAVPPRAPRSTIVVVDGARVLLEGDGARIVRVDLLAMGRPGAAPLGDSARSADSDPILDLAAREVTLYLKGKLRRFTVPFAQPGTAFQRRVWAVLAAVPYGRRVTYGALAALAGSPGGARAVGSAMHRNRLPLLVPCHRVVAVGGLGGFGCGLGWKRLLLGLESRP